LRTNSLELLAQIEARRRSGFPKAQTGVHRKTDALMSDPVEKVRLRLF